MRTSPTHPLTAAEGRQASDASGASRRAALARLLTIAVRPATIALHRMSMFHKFLVCGLVLFVPLSYEVVALRREVSASITFASDERAGLRELTTLIEAEIAAAGPVGEDIPGLTMAGAGVDSAGVGPVARAARSIADASNLTLDPVLETYYLGQVIATDVPELIDLLDQPPRLETALPSLLNRTAAHLVLGGLDATLIEPLQAVSVDASTRARRLPDEIRALVGEVADELDGLLAARVEASTDRSDRATWMAIGGLICALYVIAALYVAVSTPIGEIKHRLGRARDGTHGGASPPPGRDELAHVAAALEATLADLQQSQERLSYQASHDLLTGLPNRSALHLVLAQHDRPAGSWRAAMFVDLDRFKLINDRYGHAAGDQTLTVMSCRLRAATRSTDLVGRLAGDEFLVVLDHIDSPEQALAIAHRIQDEMAAPIPIVVDGQHQSLHVSASIGVAMLPPDSGLPLGDVVRQADLAMYEAKRRGTWCDRPVRTRVQLAPRGAVAHTRRAGGRDRPQRVRQPLSGDRGHPVRPTCRCRVARALATRSGRAARTGPVPRCRGGSRSDATGRPAGARAGLRRCGTLAA